MSHICRVSDSKCEHRCSFAFDGWRYCGSRTQHEIWIQSNRKVMYVLIEISFEHFVFAHNSIWIWHTQICVSHPWQTFAGATSWAWLENVGRKKGKRTTKLKAQQEYIWGLLPRHEATHSTHSYICVWCSCGRNHIYIKYNWENANESPNAHVCLHILWISFTQPIFFELN